MTDGLRRLLWSRAGASNKFSVEGYERALADITDLGDGAYVNGDLPLLLRVDYGRVLVVDPTTHEGPALDLAETRRLGFELFVMADLMEASR